MTINLYEAQNAADEKWLEIKIGPDGPFTLTFAEATNLRNKLNEVLNETPVSKHLENV